MCAALTAIHALPLTGCMTLSTRQPDTVFLCAAHLLTIAAETPEADELIDAVSDELANLAERFKALSADFELVKKDALGRLISKFNQLEEVVTRFEGKTFDFATLRDEINVLQSLDVQSVYDILMHAEISDLSTVIARPNVDNMW